MGRTFDQRKTYDRRQCWSEEYRENVSKAITRAKVYTDEFRNYYSKSFGPKYNHALGREE